MKRTVLLSLLVLSLFLALPRPAFPQALVGVRIAAHRLPAGKAAVLAGRMRTAKDAYVETRLRGRCGGPERDAAAGLSPGTAPGAAGRAAPALPPPSAPSLRRVYIRRHGVKVTVVDGVAVTEIDQLFHNPNPWQLEGTYVCPLPEGAVVDRFSIYMSGREVQAEALAREKARKIYDDIVRRMRDPGLVELQGGASPSIRTHVFPIPGRGDMRVRLRYLHVMTPSYEGEYRYVCPLLSLGADEDAPLSLFAFHIDVFSRQPVLALGSRTHRMGGARKGPGRAVAWYHGKDCVPRRDLSVSYRADREQARLTVHTFRDRRGGFFLAVLHPGARPLYEPRLAFEGAETTGLFPAELPSRIPAGRPVLVLGRFDESASPGARAVFTGRLLGRVHRCTADLDPDGRKENAFLPSLWAAEEVQRLEKVLRARPSDTDRKEAVFRLALRYGILTHRTSLLAKEE